MPARTRILRGDVREVLGKLPEASFDACLCDPPYGLTANKRGGSGAASVNLNSAYGRARIGTGNGAGGFMGKKWDAEIPGPEAWAEILRVLKPGAFLLAFGGTRTHHRLMCAIEDAGFEIPDCLMWLYGSGFPKSLNVALAIDKAARGVPQGGADPTSVNHGKYKGGCSEENERGQGFGAGPGQFMREAGAKTDREFVPEAARWSGYGTALKPAWEPVIVAMKPCDGTYAENALRHGVAGLNVDGCRIETAESLNGGAYAKAGCDRHDGAENWRYRRNGDAGDFQQPTGRWPANVILDEEAGRLLDEQSGDRSSTRASGNPNNPTHRELPGQAFSWGGKRTTHDYRDSGGASRFFYCAKASPKERGPGNTHPTVKPLKLTEYLARLILPPKRDTPRRLVVPFAGSGSEIIGARRAGWDEIVGVEIEREYIRIARTRLAAAAHR